MMDYQILMLATLVLMFSSATVGLYLVTDYFMDPGFPEVFGQACGDTIQDDCLWVNSHLNTFGIADYGSNKDCLLTIDAGSAPGAIYKMLWKRFKVESGDCSSDYLEMYDTSLYNINSSSNLIGRFCGRSYPNITSYPTQRYLTFKWHTDGSNEDKGFKVLAVRNLPYPCSDDYYHCKAENRCIDGRLKCDGIEQCDNGEDESSCSIWEKILGGFLALGTAGIVGVVGAIMFACILIGVTICTFTCCKNSCKNCWGNLCSKCKQHNKIGNQGKTGKLPPIEPSTKPRNEQTKIMADQNKETVVMVDQSKETFDQTNKIKDIVTVDNIRKTDDNDRLDLVDDPKETTHQAKTRDVKETKDLTETTKVNEMKALTMITDSKKKVNQPKKTDFNYRKDLPKKTADLTKTSDVNERIGLTKKTIDQTNTTDVKDLTEKTEAFDTMHETKELVDKETFEQDNINVKGTVSQSKQTGDQTTDKSDLKSGLCVATNLTVNPLQVSDANNMHYSEQEERKNTYMRGRQPASDITKVDS